MFKKLLLVLLVVLISGVAHAAPVTHSWWQTMTPTQVTNAFEQGRIWQRQGYSLTSLDYGIWIEGQLGDITIEEAHLRTPMLDCVALGLSAERRMDSDTEINKSKAAAISGQTGPTEIEFGVYLTSTNSLKDLTSVTFAVETDKGVRLDKLKSPDPSTSVGHTTSFSSSWFNCHHHPTFKLNSDQVNSDTKWLRLWIISFNSKSCVTFMLDGSSLIQYNDNKPIEVTIPHK